MMSTTPLNVLFVCTHNSARSILAEGLLNGLGGGRFRGFSAGSQPRTAPNPLAIETLARLGMPAEGYRSKDWNEFAQPGGFHLHRVRQRRRRSLPGLAGAPRHRPLGRG
jgi:arsenate reductase